MASYDNLVGNMGDSAPPPPPPPSPQSSPPQPGSPPIRLAQAVGDTPAPPMPPGPPIAPTLPANMPPPVGGNHFAAPGVAAAPNLRQFWTGDLSPEEKSVLHQRNEAMDASIAKMSGVAERYAQTAAEAPPGTKERMEAIAEMRRASQEMQEEFRKKVASPPIEKPIDAMRNFGSTATVLGLLVGLVSRQHLTAGLNAAGAAMRAINENNHESFEKQYETWKMQTQLGLQMINMENQDIRQLLDDQKMAIDERSARLQTMATELGFDKALASMGADTYDQGLNLLSKRDALQARAQEHADMIQMHYDAMRLKMNQGPGYEQSKTIEVLDKDGNVVKTMLAREQKGQPGWVDSATGQKIDLAPGQTLREITPTTGGAGRAGAQVLRQEIAGREVLSDLQNATSLPVGSTTGYFGQYEPGSSILGATKNVLVRKLTSQDAQLMQGSMASLSRELSVLMSPVYGGSWAAKQIDPLIPVAGDSIGTTIFKMARLAQSADNALEAIQKSPILSNDQKEYAKDLRAEIVKAIPWTSAQAMAFARQGEGGESFGDFVKRNKIGGPSEGNAASKYTARNAAGVVIHSDDGIHWKNPDGTPYAQ